MENDIGCGMVQKQAQYGRKTPKFCDNAQNGVLKRFAGARGPLWRRLLSFRFRLRQSAQAVDSTQGPVASNAIVEQVTVTARRRRENAQDVPLSVTALPGVTLQRDQTDFLSDLVAKVPSITTYWSNPKQVLISLRGLG